MTHFPAKTSKLIQNYFIALYFGTVVWKVSVILETIQNNYTFIKFIIKMCLVIEFRLEKLLEKRCLKWQKLRIVQTY